jgi:hypothetical protein
MTEKTKVFVSYASEDIESVQSLVDELKMRGFDVWFDRDKIDYGDDFVDAMKNGIEQSHVFLICLSPSFTNKPPESWVRDELRMAMLKEKEDGQKRIIPIRLIRGGDTPRELGTRAFADLSSEEKWNQNFPRLVKSIKKQKQKQKNSHPTSQ